MTATATIDVRYVDPPKNGNPKAPWAAKDAQGQRWKFWPDRAGKIEPGQTVSVEWKEGEPYNGKVENIIVKVLGTSGDTGPTAPRPSNGSAPAGNGYNSYRKTDPGDARRMWVCAIVVAGIEAGKVDPFAEGDIEAAGKAALRASQALFPDLH